MSRAFTLLELLLAIALLSVIVVAAVTWTRLATRGVAAVRAAEADLSAERAALALLRDDLRLAAQITIDDQGAVTAATLHGLEHSPARRTVRWAIDAEGRLTRSEAAADGRARHRPVLGGLRPGRFHLAEDGALWWLRDLAPEQAPEDAAARQLVWGAAW